MAELYIANLGKYNEGYLVGDWITLPFDEDEFEEFLAEQVGINEEYEEYAIHDTDDMPFKVGEYDNVLKVNEKYQAYEEAVEYHGEDVVDAIVGYYGFDEGMEILDGGDFIYWNGCDNMTDVAYEMVNEYGLPNDKEYYFDYEKFIQDLEYDDFFDEYMEAYGGEMKYHEKEAIAMEMVEYGMDDEMLKSYFDYDAFGETLAINGTFIDGEDGIVEILY